MDGEKKSIEDALRTFANDKENVNVDKKSSKNTQKSMQDTFAEEAYETVNSRMSLSEERELKRQEVLNNAKSIGHGYIEIPLQDLPSRGMFYPEGAKIMVRAASGSDIRHWSMIDEKNLQDVNDGLNYIVERCVQISFPPETGIIGNWKDLKEIDRFYLLLCIRDFTFTEGHNELKIKVSENKEIVVHKDNISFIDLGEKIMKYYNSELRCFTFDTKTPAVGKLNFFLPSVGSIQWLTDYVKRKSNRQEAFDEDFVKIAPMLIKDHRLLNEKNYGELIYSSMSWGVYEWSLVSKVKSTLEKAITPKMVYTDEEGAEKETPLNFRGGIKALFTFDLDDELDL